MIGLILATIYGCYTSMIGGKPPQISFKSATGFLFRWYVTIAVILMVVFGLMIIGGSTMAGLLAGGPFGGLFGSVIGTSFAFVVFLVVGFSYVLEIIGARLLHKSLTLIVRNDDSYCWNRKKVFWGAVFLFVGLFGVPFLS